MLSSACPVHHEQQAAMASWQWICWSPGSGSFYATQYFPQQAVSFPNRDHIFALCIQYLRQGILCSKVNPCEWIKELICDLQQTTAFIVIYWSLWKALNLLRLKASAFLPHCLLHTWPCQRVGAHVCRSLKPWPCFFPYFSVSYFYDFLKTRLLLKEKIYKEENSRDGFQNFKPVAMKMAFT